MDGISIPRYYHDFLFLSEDYSRIKLKIAFSNVLDGFSIILLLTQKFQINPNELFGPSEVRYEKKLVDIYLQLIKEHSEI